ncbi:kinesin-like protein KIN-7O isoform X1 [Gossypium raimondii]|uniref:kinesin-like protein KIN-7O isoform X1 n=1 Tax=Gossypium raimondii TaxID=29730 RepID=UPI00227B8A53|nr:kinesin-like protein KIN-7O isoform X1 [Gossypium raimondii]
MMANKKATCCRFMLMWLLARKLFGKKLSLEQSSFSQQGMEASIKRLLAEKEELAMQLTNSLLEMEEEKAIQCAREKASIEAIEEKRKLYNSQITSLSEKLSEVRVLCLSLDILEL